MGFDGLRDSDDERREMVQRAGDLSFSDNRTLLLSPLHLSVLEVSEEEEETVQDRVQRLQELQLLLLRVLLVLEHRLPDSLPPLLRCLALREGALLLDLALRQFPW